MAGAVPDCSQAGQAIASALLLFDTWLPLTTVGWWFVMAQAIVVTGFVDVQIITLLKQSRTAA